MPAFSHTFVWTGGSAGSWTVAANWNRNAVPGADDIADIGNGADSPVVTVPSGSTPTPTDPDGVPVGAVQIASGAELIIASGENVGNYYNLASGYSPSTSTFTIEGVSRSSNAGTILVSDGASLRVTGRLDNTGVISLNSAANTAASQADVSNLVIVGKSSQGVAGGVDLTGGGTVQLSDSYNNVINGEVLQKKSADVLRSDNTIEGAGFIDNLVFYNSGTVNGKYADNFLVLDNDTIVNSGTLLSSAIKGLAIDGGTTVTNVGKGEIEAANSSSYVWIGDATIIGGTLSGGIIIDGASTFDGWPTMTIAADSNVNVDEVALTLEGNINNQGTFYVETPASATGELVIKDNVRLGGGGNVVLSAGEIVDNGSWASLLNNETISGYGEIGSGDGKFLLVNDQKGVIDATDGALTIDTGNAILNFGEIEATAGGSLTIVDAVDNFSHSLGANGGNLTVEGAVVGGGLDISGATLTLGSSAFGVAADFHTGNGELKLEDAPGFKGTISGFGQTGNEIDLTDVPYVSGETKWSFTENKAGTAGTLVINDSAAGGPTIDLHLLGLFTASNFTVGPDSTGIVAAASKHADVVSGPAGALISYTPNIIAT